MLMATARRYTLEQIEATRKKLRSLPMKEAGKTRGEVAEFLVNDIRKAMRQGYTLRDIRDLLADAGVSVPLTKLKALFEKTGYVPSRVLVEGLAEIGKILEEGRNYMAGLEGKEKRRIALLLESIESLQN